MIKNKYSKTGNRSIFGTQLVTMEHPKNVTSLSKLIKQPKIITQQPNKIKVYK